MTLIVMIGVPCDVKLLSGINNIKKKSEKRSREVDVFL